eukprot:4943961-Amphidinium_carterae.1
MDILEERPSIILTTFDTLVKHQSFMSQWSWICFVVDEAYKLQMVASKPTCQPLQQHIPSHVKKSKRASGIASKGRIIYECSVPIDFPETRADGKEQKSGRSFATGRNSATTN